MPIPITVLLADDSQIIRRAISRILDTEPSIKLLAEAENFSQAISMAAALKPDVVLLDLHMPDGHAFSPELVNSQLALCGSRVVAMSLLKDEDDGYQALAKSFGAAILLDKAEFGTQLIPTIVRLGVSTFGLSSAASAG